MYRRISIVFVSLFATLVFLCGSTCYGLKPGEGFVDVPGGKVWYRVVGEGKGTPLLVLHGGPGVPSYYLKPLGALGSDRPVIFYDQLGCGHSPGADDSTLWTIPRFLRELDAIRSALKLADVDIYGHSWGSILAFEYASAHPKGVHCLILAGPALDIPQFQRDADSLLLQMPDSIQQVVNQTVKAGAFESPEYQAAVMQYYQKFLARRQPWSADIDSSFAQINPKLYAYVNGPSEFTLTGTFRDYDCTARMKDVRIPVLYVAGEFDEARPSTARHFQSLTPKSELAVIQNAGHLAMQDEPEQYVQTLRKFLSRFDHK
ncbi:MAG: proline iminopeptidase-family hydrolase [candidate division Zixibacteria bacterium]|nr:proline iminopeptidase-family hydrolase [candidate division Zixibacteria bacterium]